VASVERSGDAVRVSLDGDEVAVLANLAEQVVTMLEPDAAPARDPLEDLVGLSGGPVPAPDDPALQRLLPDGYADAGAAVEFRRLTDGELRGVKTAALRRLVADVGAGDVDLELAPDAVDAWLQALNDVRLVVGTRLDIQEDTGRRRIKADDPRVPLFMVYDWLTALQDRLVEVVMDPA
jgi:Domain of unknown function (DUF2017)